MHTLKKNGSWKGPEQALARSNDLLFSCGYCLLTSTETLLYCARNGQQWFVTDCDADAAGVPQWTFELSVRELAVREYYRNTCRLHIRTWLALATVIMSDTHMAWLLLDSYSIEKNMVQCAAHSIIACV